MWIDPRGVEQPIDWKKILLSFRCVRKHILFNKADLMINGCFRLFLKAQHTDL